MCKKLGVNELTVSDLAAKYNVSKRVVLGWCGRGVFPNAYKTDSGYGFEVWKIPQSDLENFELPKSGRKQSENPSKAALAKRRQREQEKQNSKDTK